MNFKIQENGEGYWDREKDFIQLYKNGVTAKEIRNQLQLTTKAYSNLLNKCSEEGKIKRRNSYNKKLKKEKHQPKHYHFDNSNQIYQVTYKNQYYANFKNLQQAQAFVKLMQECDWDYNQRKSIKEYILKKGVSNL